MPASLKLLFSKTFLRAPPGALVNDVTGGERGPVCMMILIPNGMFNDAHCVVILLMFVCFRFAR